MEKYPQISPAAQMQEITGDYQVQTGGERGELCRKLRCKGGEVAACALLLADGGDIEVVIVAPPSV